MAWSDHGIQTSYQGEDGTVRRASRAGLDAALEAMGGGDDARTRSEDAVWVIRQGETRPVDVPSELRLEDGTTLSVEAFLPRDLPLGYHDLAALEGGRPTRVIVSPGRCFLPDDLLTWGWAVQLYALRSRCSWGIGDLADLRELGR
jgi:4-alpha-glucanotransferase